MESFDVLRVTNVLWVPELWRSVFSVSAIEEKGYAVLYRDGQVLFMPKVSSSDQAVILGVKASNLYRLKDQPMRSMASSSRVTENREQVALKVVQTQRDPDFRGSQQDQRESPPLRGSLPSGSNGREESSKTVKKVSWVEEARQEAQKQEASRSSMSSKEEPCHTTTFTSVIEGATNQVDWSVAMVVDQVWEAKPLPVWEIELLPGDIGVGENNSLAKREC
jgi:hypothetical protein